MLTTSKKRYCERCGRFVKTDYNYRKRTTKCWECGLILHQYGIRRKRIPK